MTITQSFKLLSAAILLTATISRPMEEPESSIAPYNHDRDYAAIKAIMEAEGKLFLYPNQPLEYTVKFFTSDKYKTDVLRVNDTTVGFINYTVYDIPGKRIAMLHLLGVDKDHRRKGYAKQLSELVIEYGKNDGADQVFLMTKTDLTGVRKLYEKLGFKGMVGPTDATYTLDLK